MLLKVQKYFEIIKEFQQVILNHIEEEFIPKLFHFKQNNLSNFVHFEFNSHLLDARLESKPSFTHSTTRLCNNSGFCTGMQSDMMKNCPSSDYWPDNHGMMEHMSHLVSQKKWSALSPSHSQPTTNCLHGQTTSLSTLLSKLESCSISSTDTDCKTVDSGVSVSTQTTQSIQSDSSDNSPTALSAPPELPAKQK